MAKRGSTSDINRDNWDDPFVAEEAGKFKTASADTLQKRIIRTAKRRIKPGENEGGKNVFASFGGFKPVASTTNSAMSGKTFSFLGGPTPTSSITPTTNGAALTTPIVKTEESPRQKYLTKLQQLNCSVTDWIKTHVDSDPVCILTPVFNDYEKHLKQIQDERDMSEKSGSTTDSSTLSSTATFTFVSSSPSDNKFTMNFPTTSLESNKTTLTVTNSSADISSPSDNKPSALLFAPPVATGKSPLLQGSETSKPVPSSIFSSFKSESTGSSFLSKPDPPSLMVNPFISKLSKQDLPEVKPFSFSNGAAPTSSSSSSNKDGEEEESDEPPKVEFTPVKEEGSVFSTRCKVFVKKDNNYKERGVGTLFIKKVGEEKHQLLVRAETVLGNILVNVLLSSGIPTQRMGKNNVMLVCMPTPQDLPPPTTVLLRVKTSDEADELLATIDQHKN